jgi:hypothetical protein
LPCLLVFIPSEEQDEGSFLITINVMWNTTARLFYEDPRIHPPICGRYQLRFAIAIAVAIAVSIAVVIAITDVVVAVAVLLKLTLSLPLL